MNQGDQPQLEGYHRFGFSQRSHFAHVEAIVLRTIQWDASIKHRELPIWLILSWANVYIWLWRTCENHPKCTYSNYGHTHQMPIEKVIVGLGRLASQNKQAMTTPRSGRRRRVSSRKRNELLVDKTTQWFVCKLSSRMVVVIGWLYFFCVWVDFFVHPINACQELQSHVTLHSKDLSEQDFHWGSDNPQ